MLNPTHVIIWKPRIKKMHPNETYLSSIFAQKLPLPNRFPKVQPEAHALELTLAQDQFSRDASL
jgi:hypothetical protein